MTLTEQMITVAMVVLGTAVTRFLPFLIDAEIYTVSWKSPSCRSVRAACNLQPEKCEYIYRKPRPAGIDFNCAGYFSACVEAADASLHCRRYGVLYAAGAACFLNRREEWIWVSVG